MGNILNFSRATRRLLAMCALVLTLGIPAESILLAAMRAPDAAAAAEIYVAKMDRLALQDAALNIQNYPFFYRRAIMTALEPEDRAQAWRRYLSSYAAAHPDLDGNARAVLTRGAAAMTPDVFDNNPPQERLIELANVFDIALTVFGRRTATDLFMRLGPDDTSADWLPVAERAANHVRNWINVYARENDCECATAFPTSCDIAGAAGDTCSDANGCDPVGGWPMCGVAWAAPCTGMCTTILHQ